MTNSWAMLHDEMEEMRIVKDEMEELRNLMYNGHFGGDQLTEEVVVTETAKDANFWKYSEGKILREVEAYLSSTYNGHYVGEDNKIQTLDLIDSIGDAESFCRSNAIKYLSRFGKKDGKNPKDLLKVIHYAFLLYHFSDLPFTEDAVETHSPTGR
jgi:hypothetical protein